MKEIPHLLLAACSIIVVQFLHLRSFFFPEIESKFAMLQYEPSVLSLVAREKSVVLLFFDGSL